MRFYVMDKIGIDGAPFRGFSWKEFQKKVYHMVDDYLDNPYANFENTMGAWEDLKPLFLSWRWPVDEYQSIYPQ